MNPFVLVPVADGSEEIETVTVVDVLRRAECNVVLASVSASKTVTMSRKTVLVVDSLIKDCLDKEWDCIVLPGGMPGAENLKNSLELKKLLTRQVEQKKFFAAICAAPAVVLDYYGFLKNRKATCYPSFSFKDANRVDENVVVDENCITSKSPATAMEFALTISKLLTGEEKTKKIAQAMLFNLP